MAISHAAPSELTPLDDILTRLLVRLQISHEEALMHFHFAPLSARRDMALLSIIHRAALRKGPPQLHHFFMRARAFNGHSRTVLDPCVGRPLLIMRRSIFVFTPFYYNLPEEIIQIQDIVAFQKRLQDMFRKAINENLLNWYSLFRSRYYHFSRRPHYFLCSVIRRSCILNWVFLLKLGSRVC